MQSHLISALHASAPAADRAEKLRLYGWLVGDWTTRVIAHAPDGAKHEADGEIHAGWILDGLAIQDVWMIPRAPGAAAFPIAGNWHGTTLRIYDPALDAWRILWIDPGRNTFRQQVGRSDGPDIVQLGKTDDGRHTRWRFTEIAADSFHWKGESSADGQGWQLHVDVLARRA